MLEEHGLFLSLGYSIGYRSFSVDTLETACIWFDVGLPCICGVGVTCLNHVGWQMGEMTFSSAATL